MKLEGKALGFVQLVSKGEGLEAWRQLKLEYEGKSGNRQAALLRGILNPRAASEADTRDGRSVVESLNRWEKTIGLYRTASGVDISDGILAATVLEHSLESYQHIPEASPFPCARIVQRNAWLVTRIRRDVEEVRRDVGIFLRIKLMDQWPMDVDQTRAVSGFSSGKDGKGKSKGKIKRKDANGKGNGKKGDKSKDQKPISKPEPFQGYCGYCEKKGHKRADCRKRIADGKLKGGAAEASADNDGDVAAVIDVDDAAMGTEDDETSTG